MTPSPGLRSETPARPAVDGRTPGPRFRLGTRGSALAVMQSSTIADALRALGAEVELVTVRTLGDDRPPDTTWGEGAFVGALESALLDGSVDIAVHSAKDVPTTVPDALSIAAYPGREDPRDALVGRDPGLTLDSLPAGSRVGTDSPRRSAFLRALRPDLRLHPLHGNVDTRLRRLDEGETDALVLAVAGLTRLGRADRIGSILPADAVPPAPGQGSLAVECRTDDAIAVEWLARLDDPATRAAVEAERAFLRACGGGCRAPIGAIARVEDGEIVLQAATAGVEAPNVAPEERPLIARGSRRGPVSDRLTIAADLASELTRELARHAGDPADDERSGGHRVIVTRSQGLGPLAEALAGRGLRVIAVPTIAIEPADPAAIEAVVARFPAGGWIALTSGNAVRPVVEAIARAGRAPDAFRWAAVGSATAQSLAALGIPASFMPSHADGASLATGLPLDGAPVLLPRSEIADGATPDRLRARGADVVEVVAYRTVEGPAESRDAARAAFGPDGPTAIVFTSGSTVRGLLALLGPAHAVLARSTPACCIGESTATVARELGFTRVVVASGPTPESIADAVAPLTGASATTTSLGAPSLTSDATPSPHRSRAGRARGGSPVKTLLEATSPAPESAAASAPEVPTAPEVRTPPATFAFTPDPSHRLRRTRRTSALRALVRETRVHPRQLVAPIFVQPGLRRRDPISSLPGVARLSPDEAVAEAQLLAELGVGGVILFGLPEAKDFEGSGAWIEDGIVQETLRALREADPDLVLIADTCLCEYTDHGHCGPLAEDDQVDNDAAIALLARTAVAQARAGADIVAPSAMMDGQVAAIRAGLDDTGFSGTSILAYAAKTASAYYGPFREAADSAPAFGDRRGYQMDPANRREALREMRVDVGEGADALLVKPAMPSLDILAAARAEFDLPIAAYQVSGEYAQIEAAARLGWIDRRRTHLEAVTSIVRAGAGFVITYAAADIATWLREGND